MISAGSSVHQGTIREIGNRKDGPVEQIAHELTFCDVLNVTFVAEALSKAPSTRGRGIVHVGRLIQQICDGGRGGCVQDSTWNRLQHNVVSSPAGVSTTAPVNFVPLIFLSHYRIK